MSIRCTMLYHGVKQKAWELAHEYITFIEAVEEAIKRAPRIGTSHTYLSYSPTQVNHIISAVAAQLVDIAKGAFEYLQLLVALHEATAPPDDAHEMLATAEHFIDVNAREFNSIIRMWPEDVL